MKYSRSRNSLTLLLLAAVLFCGPITTQAQLTEPLLQLSAGEGVATDTGGVVSWTSTVGGYVFVVGDETQRPEFVDEGDAGQPMFRFMPGQYLIGPDIFPVGNDYTLYVVARTDNQPGANNLFSGRSRALYLASSPNPRVLHNGNFQQQCASTIDMNGLTIIRVEHTASTGRTRVYLNNELGGEAVIPQNTDPTTLIAAYNNANFFTGVISEIILFDQELDKGNKLSWDNILHQKYKIPRTPDPEPTPIDIVEATQDLALIPEGGSIRFTCENPVPTIIRVTITLDSNGYQIANTIAERPNEGWGEMRISLDRPATLGLHEYHMRVTVTDDVDQEFLVYEAGSIVCGEVIAIEGQSNSIFNDRTLTASSWARTFGSNFGQSFIDTTFKRSIATGNGGGANVGGWGLFLQNQFAQQLGIPTCVINGGVGGTRIEAHFPNDDDRMNLSTIYGSWLYRLEKSGLKNHVRWMFWYQGESNAGADGYGDLFERLYTEWKKDLPNLEHVVVIQIRPGCGGADHATLRDEQRTLEGRFNDVIVHTACALPGHDGCHFTAAGYRELGNQLFNLVHDIREAPSIQSPYLAPRPIAAGYDESQRTVAITFDRAEAIFERPTAGRELREAFFFNGFETVLPDTVWTRGTTVIMRAPAEETIRTVSYVPSKNYLLNDPTVFAGPWIVDERGVGALSFHNIPLVPTSVEEDSGELVVTQIARKGERVELPVGIKEVHFIDVSGRVVAVREVSVNRVEVPKSLETGLFLLKNGQNQAENVGKLLVIP